MAIKDVASAFGSSGYGSIHQEGAGVGNTKEGGVAFLWRALTVVAVLAIFSTALSSANSRWTADNLKASTIRKQQQTTGGVFQVRLDNIFINRIDYIWNRLRCSILYVQSFD